MRIASTILSIFPNQTASYHFWDINWGPAFNHGRGHTLPHSTSSVGLNFQAISALETNLYSFNITLLADSNTLINVLQVLFTNNLHIYHLTYSLRLSFSSLLGLYSQNSTYPSTQYFFGNMAYLFWTLISAGNKKFLFF